MALPMINGRILWPPTTVNWCSNWSTEQCAWIADGRSKMPTPPNEEHQEPYRRSAASIVEKATQSHAATVACRAISLETVVFQKHPPLFARNKGAAHAVQWHHLQDTVLGRTLINEVETESLQNAFNIPDDLTESTENPASSAHESELDEVSHPAMSTRMPRLRRPPEYLKDYLME